MNRAFAFCAAMLLFAAGCGQKTEEPRASLTPQEMAAIQAQAAQVFGALPERMPGAENDSPAQIALGAKLFLETKLSVNGTQSCNSCHGLNTAGVDGKPVSAGALGRTGTRNSPTVLNAGFQFVQFWDGRAKDLAEQAKGPILNPVEMGIHTEKDAEKAIAAMPEYAELFAKAFPDDANPINFENIAGAIAAFERTQISRSVFDYFCSGNVAALNTEQATGLRQFMNTGCITCHTGPLAGGGMFQKLGLVKPYKNAADLGRFVVTKNEADKFLFKVPQLRNVALTAPYFHDGSIASLHEAVKTMAELNLGKQLTDAEAGSIVAFLNALSGAVKKPA
jgi:cytochrome c peroxidase